MLLSQLALFVGAVISVCACVSVIIKYIRYRQVLRPPFTILFWRTVADLCFSMQFLLTFFVQLGLLQKAPYEHGNVFWGRFPHMQHLCSIFAFVTQFFAFASELWLAMLCIDLVLSLTQPFRPLTSNEPKYHAIVWLSSLASACVLVGFHMEGPSAIHICWVRTDNTSAAALPDSECGNAVWDWSETTIANWVLFFGWVVGIISFCIVVVAFATARLSEGLQATYEVRLQTIKNLRLYVGSGFFYWCVAGLFYYLLLLNCYPDWTTLRPGKDAGPAALWVGFALTIAGKGLVDALLWHFTASRVVKLSPKRRGGATGAGGTELDDDERGDTPFGVPEALREEWLDYTQLGIRVAVNAAEAAIGTPRENVRQRVLMLPSIRESDLARANGSTSHGCGSSTDAWGATGSSHTLPLMPVDDATGGAHGSASGGWWPSCCTRKRCLAFMAGGGPPFAFTEYFPAEFQRLRQQCGVTSAAYLASLISGGQVWVRRTKEGKGGRWRFSEGKSGSFMYYTHDRALLVKTIDSTEAGVLKQHGEAYAQYMLAHPGSYLARFYGVYSISMYNTTMYFVVMANVFATAPPRAPGEPLLDERYDLKGSWVDRNSSRPKDPLTVKKDNDLNYSLHLTPHRLAFVRKQMSADVSFLAEDLHVMDYSLIVGVRHGRFAVTDAGPQTQYTRLQQLEGGASLLVRGASSSRDSPTCGSFAGAASPLTHSHVRPAVGGSTSTSVLGDSAPDGLAEMRLSATGNSCGGILPLAGTTVRATERSADDSPDGAPVGVELASIVEGPQSYHMGIIDILQVWSLRKRLERFAKTWFRCSNADGISATPPSDYAQRFTERVIYEVFDAPHGPLSERPVPVRASDPMPQRSVTRDQLRAAAAVAGASTPGGIFRQPGDEAAMATTTPRGVPVSINQERAEQPIEQASAADGEDAQEADGTLAATPIVWSPQPTQAPATPLYE